MATHSSYEDHENALAYLQKLIIWRLQYPEASFKDAPKVDGYLQNGILSAKIKKLQLSNQEIAILLLAIAPHLKPNLIGESVASQYPNGGELPELGGVKGKYHRGILPTGETALFLIAGTKQVHRTRAMPLFDKGAKLFSHSVLTIELVPAGEPILSGKLLLEDDYVHLFTTGSVPSPDLSMDFPAMQITTPLNWDDLVLSQETLEEINHLKTWLEHKHRFTEKYDPLGRFKQGYKALFHGPSGTGKTLTASLLGKETGRAVYRVDLSIVVSKFIGETEKNLSALFNKAENKDWILFFDEADALFGKRTQVRDAHDKYANQEVSYLLQRLENHNGLVILASNLKTNIDTAFTRRFDALISFKNPDRTERKLLWQKILPKSMGYDKVDLDELAKTYEVAGANIQNIIHHCCLQAVKEKRETINFEQLKEGVKREYRKEEKMF